MASQAYYRKWRSQRFGDLVGQEPVARTLRNAVRLNRLAHAYVFCGPRGVGKTSAARILAKAVNCPNAVDGEPCGTCESCRSIQDGNAIDVTEVDAASTNGIDDIREIRERVALSPATLRYKFYILDEAHMLSNAAFNGLLKTLEEPPPHAIFVLVTTETQKLPETVVSRCQRLDFRRIGLGDAVGRLRFVCDEEGISPEEGVLELLARASSGSLRDAEGALDQLVAYAGTQPTVAAARAILGAAGPDAARELLGYVVSNQVESAIRRVNQLVEEGADPNQIALDVVECLRSILLLRTSDALVDLVDEGPEALPALRQLARALLPPQIVELIRSFTLGPALRGGTRPQLPLEMSIVEAANRLGQPPAQRAEAPIQTAERRGPPMPPTATSRPSIAPPSIPPSNPPAFLPERPAAGRSDLPTVAATVSNALQEGEIAAPAADGNLVWQEATRQWNQILEVCGRRNRSVQALLRAARPVGGQDNAVVLGFPYEFHRERIEDQKNRLVVEDAIGEVLGRRVIVRCTMMTRDALPAIDPMQAILEDPVVKAAISLGARVRSVTDESPSEEK